MSEDLHRRTGGLPTGTVTLLFTDIEGSTRRWERNPVGMSRAMARHDELIRETLADHKGVRPSDQGEGDSVVAAFRKASDAVRCAIALQRAFHAEKWPEAADIHLRMGLHTGDVQLRDQSNYFGPVVYRCARLRSLAHGGQILMSRTTSELVADSLEGYASIKDLGVHRLKDLARPERVYQVSHPDLPDDFPPLMSVDALPNNLPLQMTNFVGRESEIDVIKTLLAEGRIVTLSGTGGCGKTRLAIQVGVEVLEDYSDGVWLVDLAPMNEESLLPNAVASVLSLREVPGQPVVRTLENHLRYKKLLLILDNCEHLISGSAQLAETLLNHCESLRIMATSREPLNIPGETVWRVPALSIPDETQTTAKEQVSRFEAARLFVDRALKSRPTFELTDDNASHVARICRRLDGIPLAIELAAARVSALTPKEIDVSLSEGFRVLGEGSRTALPRQQTLEASLDWSYRLLTEQEQILLRRLAVFAGGFTLTAAEEVCSDDRVGQEHVLGLVRQLVDKSLVQMQEGGGTSRYRLLETIRQYGMKELLTSGEEELVRNRHLEFCLDLTERADVEMEGSKLLQWLGRLELEHDNVRAALEWSSGPDRAEKGLRLAAALRRFWAVRHPREGRAHLEAALAAGVTDPALRAKALIATSSVSLFLGDMTAARSFGHQALAGGEESRDKRTTARAQQLLGWTSIFLDPGAARPLFKASIETSRETGDSWCLAYSLNGLGYVEAAEGKPGGAQRLLHESLELARERGDQAGIEQGLSFLGWSACQRGEFIEAQRLLRESLVVADELQDRWFRSFALNLLGFADVCTGEYEQGRLRLGEGLALARDSANAVGTAMALQFTGFSEYAAGGLDAAAARLEQALTLFRAMQANWFVAGVLAMLGTVELSRNQNDPAVRILEEGSEVASRNRNPWALGRCLHGRAALAQSKSDRQGAAALQADALHIFIEAGDRVGIAEGLEALGRSDSLASFEARVQFLGSAESLRRALGYKRLPVEHRRYETNVERLRAELGAKGFQAAWDRGTNLSMEQAATRAVETLRASGDSAGAPRSERPAG